DGIAPLKQIVSPQRVAVELDAAVVVEDDHLTWEIDTQGTVLGACAVRLDPLELLGAERHRQQTVLEAIVMKDAGERSTDEGADAQLQQSPNGMLAAGAAAEVRAHHQEGCIRVGGPVEDEIRARLAAAVVAQIVKHSGGKTVARDSLEKLLGHDDVGIDVVLRHWCGDAANFAKRPHSSCPRLQAAYVSDPPHDRSSSNHGGTHEMGTATAPLTTFEITIGARGAALPSLEHVVVHSEAHGAARLAPFETCGNEDTIEPLGFGFDSHLGRTGHHHGTHSRRDPASLADPCRAAQILQSRIHTRANEGSVDPDFLDRCTGPQAHI